jgi:hypothetical protein
MWIGLIVVILTTGQIVQDSAKFGSEEECKEAGAQVLKSINDSKSVYAYDLRCIRLDKFSKPGGNA